MKTERYLLIWTLSCLLSFAMTARAQNLCPNGSFETTFPCPTSLSQLTFAIPWTDAVGSTSTSDLFNACNVPVSTCFDVRVPDNFGGHAPAHTGDGYAGFIAYYGLLVREYLQVALDSSLDPATPYRVEVWIRRSSMCRYAVDKIGILISAGPINQAGTVNIALAPQIETNTVLSDTTTWTLITGIYIASGGEDYITIGNFHDNAGSNVVDLGLQGSTCVLNNNSAYYYVDDVKVERINEKVIIEGDTLICPGMSTTLSANTNVQAWWSESSTPNDTLSTAGSITVSPSVNTTYLLHGMFVTDTATVYVIQPPVVNLGNDTTICEGFSVPLNAYNPASTYNWSTGASDSIIQASVNGLYWVTVDNGGCTASDSLNLTVLTNPPVQLGPDSVFCDNDPFPLVLNAGPGSSYLWMPGGDTTQSMEVYDEETYTITVSHQNGCTTSASVTTVEECPASIFIPRAFTPNGDGRNENFSPSLDNVLAYEMKIYNRWGTLVFATSVQGTGWDGRYKHEESAEGVYVYVISYDSITTSERVDKKTIRGYFVLIR